MYHPSDVNRARQRADAAKNKATLHFTGATPSTGPGAPSVPIDRKMLLTVREACELGWTVELLERLIADGTIRQMADKIPRCDLDHALSNISSEGIHSWAGRQAS